MTPVRTIFLDFGNVIGFFDHSRAVAQLLKHTPLGNGELDRAVYGTDAMDLYESGRLTSAEFFEYAVQAGKLTCGPAEFFRAFADIFERNADVCDHVAMLKPQYRLVLASNTCPAHYERYCRDYADVLRHFDALCPSHEAGFRKPHPSYFAYCQRFAEALPEECLFVDDLPQHVAAAKTHGWRTLHYHTPERFAEQLADAGLTLNRSGPLGILS